MPRSSVRIGEVGTEYKRPTRPKPSGRCPWGEKQTARVIMIRAVKPTMFDGATCALDRPATMCRKLLECGAGCCLTPGHVVPCECAGDEPGEPGSCPS